MQDLKAVRKFVTEAGGDGHTVIGNLKFFYDMGFTPEFVKRFNIKHYSDGTSKGNIYREGARVDMMTGVYLLPFAYGVAEDIGADTKPAHSKMGRGFQAQELAIAIDNRLKELGA